MAEVYRAYHPPLDRYVAIKVLHSFLSDEKQFKARFEREAQNIAKLKHPNIVQVYDFDYEPESDSYYMVMELIDGPTLKDYLQDETADTGKLTLSQTIKTVRQSAEALAYAHQRGVPSQLFIFNREVHAITEQQSWLDYVDRNVRWFNHWLLSKGSIRTDLPEGNVN